ncbi:MAG: 2,3-bisphosphoglycerate-independent phosphoglycerate mutase [Alphaproteobacteria bacterium]|nr:2,3-bisphosphoglycerate-independent phosphoglycerate mutase [Alphaproteobacteria bacterium]MBU0798454.1 2,3-bisphosphoglycerate-independent phosphoglycerate mutase [Alphaproteobacteria bacterium]MBU0888412.1 2,3-bisphosphoglycerate-independent phosphoglycerate mutase [Alphaproteobacteria bacterium]MBU1814723.1 2,3-bisphosphoglycerate-independent phosphoglycerate mutase [Alphaproteobacteria bacterium]MBU2089614.1 2,3-bisphosphoglycerate-independent phosphoglycerate mutase [Alphaproteobacteria
MTSSKPAQPFAKPKGPVVLCILDGWGYRTDPENNGIAQAHTPVWDRLLASYPRSLLNASELHVGLPVGQMGNSEVGHMNLGAGRKVMQDLPRIDLAIQDGSLATAPELLAFAAKLKQSGGTCHLMGLLSPGGVHSHQDHMVALARILSAQGVAVKVHAFLDGRDTPPRAAAEYMARFEADLAGAASVASVIGRFFALDRDNRWERVSQAYDLMVQGTGGAAGTAIQAIQSAHARGETDEFVAPTAIAGYAGMQDGDGLLMANFRADRAREILTALLDPAFDGFPRSRVVRFAAALGMVDYSAALNKLLPCLFPSAELSNVLGKVVADAGMTQLRIAETEKYAHVTFFLNGGAESEFPGENRILVPSPKVKTYDLQPEMSAPEVTDRLEAAILSGTYDLIVVNYANGDMVGHTGIMAAAIKAAETIDGALARLETAVKQAGGVMLVTADHGNIEMMEDPTTHEAHTAHTLNLVPAILINGPAAATGLADGILADVAPTLLQLLGLSQPVEMTGQSLIRIAPDSPAAKAEARATA